MDRNRRTRSSYQDVVLLGVWLLMSYAEEQLERARSQLKEILNKVPERVRNGGVQETRAWLEMRQDAEKMLKRRGVGAAELLGMISRLK